MEVFAEGFAPREVQFAIVEQNPTMLNVTLYQVEIFFAKTATSIIIIICSYFSRIPQEEMGTLIQATQKLVNLPAFFLSIP